MSDRRDIVGSGYVVELRVAKDEHPERTVTLELALKWGFEPQSPVTRIVFEGVRDLKLADFNADLYCKIGVENIRDRGLEGLCYAVSDVEDEVVAFKCARWRPLG